MKLSRRLLARVSFASVTLFTLLPTAAAQLPDPIRASGAQRQRFPQCANTLRDAAQPGNCLEASSVPELGKLVPMSESLFISPATGRVGIGTTFPFRSLEVIGDIAVGAAPGGTFRALLRRSANNTFGILETMFAEPFGIPEVTNLVSTVSIEPRAGAVATLNGSNFLVTLTTSALDTNAGYVSVLNANSEIAGINGRTGVVFGSSKSFVQPHPLDATKEIHYVSLEGPEHGVYFRGTARLTGGRAEIVAPESFRLVAREDDLTVSLTPLGPNRGLYLARKGYALEVRENEGGTGDVEFDFLVMGARSALPAHVAIRENTHFAPQPGTTIGEGQLPGSYRELMIENGTLNADGSVNESSAAALGWRRDRGAWSGGKRESAPIARD